MNRDRSIGIDVGYEMDSQGSIPGRGMEIIYTPHCPDSLRGQLSLQGKGREADHSPPSRGEVKDGASIPPLPHES
jgi:hypothetical protein